MYSHKQFHPARTPCLFAKAVVITFPMNIIRELCIIENGFHTQLVARNHMMPNQRCARAQVNLLPSSPLGPRSNVVGSLRFA